MTDRPRFDDLERVEVEHLIAASTGRGAVKLRAVGRTAILLGEINPAVARTMACDLLEAATRAEYEQDAVAGLAAAGIGQQAIGHVLHAIRHGERARHAGGEGAS